MSKKDPHDRINICVPHSVIEKIKYYKDMDINVNVSKICAKALEDWFEENEWRTKEKPIDVAKLLSDANRKTYVNVTDTGIEMTDGASTQHRENSI